MKRWLLLLLLLLVGLLAGGCANPSSQGAEYTAHEPAQTPEAGVVRLTLEGASLAFNPGSGFVCLTRDTDASVYAAMGMDKDSALASMVEQNVYALLFDKACAAEVHICAVPVSHEDYDDMTGYPVAKLPANVKTDLMISGYEVHRCELMQNTGHRFVRAVISKTYADGASAYRVFYETCQANEQVFVNVLPYEDGPVSDALQQATDALVDSIRVY